MRWFVLLLAVVVQSVRADKLGDEIASVKTRFAAEHSLSSNELRQVVALAHQVGIKTVANIDTLNIHPSSSFYVRVSGTEQRKGQKFMQQFLSINRDDWLDPAAQVGRSKPFARNGVFYVRDKYELHSSQFGLIKIGGEERKIVLEGDTSPEMAENALSVITAGKIEFSGEEIRKKFETINLKQVRTIALNGKALFLSFNTGDRFCWWAVRGDFDGTKFVIKSIGEICA